MERGGGGWLVVGTLLGPEGTGRPCVWGWVVRLVEGLMLVVPPGPVWGSGLAVGVVG